MGDAVNIAARLEDASEAGEILVGPASYRATASSFEFDALPPIRLKGKGQPVPVYRLRSVRPRRDRTSDGFVLAFEGRHSARLPCPVHAVRSGAPALTIVGQPGFGKSRLLRELRGELGSRWRWLEVAALTHRSSATYAVLHDLFDEVLGAPRGADADRLAMAFARRLAIHMGETTNDIGASLRRFRDLAPISGDDWVLSGLTPRRDPAASPSRGRALRYSGNWNPDGDLHRGFSAGRISSSIGLLADIVAKGLLPGATLVVTSRTDAPRVEACWTPCGEAGKSG